MILSWYYEAIIVISFYSLANADQSIASLTCDTAYFIGNNVIFLSSFSYLIYNVIQFYVAQRMQRLKRKGKITMGTVLNIKDENEDILELPELFVLQYCFIDDHTDIFTRYLVNQYFKQFKQIIPNEIKNKCLEYIEGSLVMGYRFIREQKVPWTLAHGRKVNDEIRVRYDAQNPSYSIIDIKHEDGMVVKQQFRILAMGASTVLCSIFFLIGWNMYQLAMVVGGLIIVIAMRWHRSRFPISNRNFVVNQA
eukprot:142335_1